MTVYSAKLDTTRPLNASGMMTMSAGGIRRCTTDAHIVTSWPGSQAITSTSTQIEGRLFYLPNID